MGLGGGQVVKEALAGRQADDRRGEDGDEFVASFVSEQDLAMEAPSGQYSGMGILSGLHSGTESLSGPYLGIKASSGLSSGM